MHTKQLDNAMREEAAGDRPRYVVRRPGCAAWSEHKSLSDALAECEVANRIVSPDHYVYDA